MYWLTNLAGLGLLHWGTGSVLGERESRPSKIQLVIDLLIAITYTFLMVVLVKYNYLKPPLSF